MLSVLALRRQSRKVSKKKNHFSEWNKISKIIQIMQSSNTTAPPSAGIQIVINHAFKFITLQ